MIRRVRVLLDMIKFEHTLFALPLAFAGVLLAEEGWPRWRTLGYVLLAMVGARSAAMAFNRVADASLDALNPRTRDRAIPTGVVSRKAAMVLVVVSSLVFFAAAFRLNPLCFLLSPVALAVVLLYSYTKRFTTLCHLFLGVALAIAPAGGWLAVTGTLSLKPLVLCIGVAFWVAGFDVLYACMDVDFDRRTGLFSIPASLGGRRALAVARACHVLAWMCFAATGWILDLSPVYYAGVAAVGGLLVYEHLLVRPDDLRRLDVAFFTVNSWISVVLFLGVLGDKILG